MLLYFIYIEKKQPAIPQITRMIFIHLLYTKRLACSLLVMFNGQKFHSREKNHPTYQNLSSLFLN